MYPQNDCLESDWKLFQGVIQVNDLDGFSQELRDRIILWYEHCQ